MIGTVLLIFALLILALLAWVWFSSKARSTPQKVAKSKTVSIFQMPLLTSKTVASHPSAARRKLVKLLNGDAAAADRLISAVQRTNPDKDISWCTDKALHDLERDRRS
jgi:hypothetical protein